MLGLCLLGGCSEYTVDARVQTDAWTQRPDTAVDWLFVVDDSCSMEPHQTRLASHFDTLVGSLVASEIDAHLAVTTTDLRDGGGRLHDSVLTLDQPDVAARFRSALQVGTEGSGFEMGLEASLRAVTEPVRSAANRGFLRDDARLVLLYVSDEEDTSPLPVADVATGLREAASRTDRRSVSANALVVTDPRTCSEPDFVGTPGHRYAALAEHTGGLVLDLCADDLQAPLSRLSTEAAGLRDRFVLSRHAAVPTLEVEIDGGLVPCGEGWSLEAVRVNGAPATAIAFPEPPPVGTRIVARYQVGTSPPEAACD